MRVTIYKCDQCKKEIGNKVHISLDLGKYSGIAIPPKEQPYDLATWYVAESLYGSFLHFCSPEHLAKYFEGLIAKTKKV